MQTFTLVLLSALDRETLDTQGRGPQHSARQLDSPATTSTTSKGRYCIDICDSTVVCKAISNGLPNPLFTASFLYP